MYLETALTTVEATKFVYENRKGLQQALKRYINYARKGHVRIAVFGLGGTGKTTLGEFLSGKLKPSSEAGRYILSYKTESVSLNNDYVSSLIIPGGQERRILNDWPEIYRNLAEGRSRGVINVVSYGYHAFSDVNYQETKYFEEITATLDRRPTKEEFVEAYSKIQRDNELKILRELVPHIKAARGNIWMITLVTKQDLWWKDRQNVARHYTDGEYNAILMEIAKNRGEQHFSHEYVSASLLTNNFRTNDGDLLIPTAEGYDQSLQVSNQTNLVKVINSFIERSKN